MLHEETLLDCVEATKRVPTDEHGRRPHASAIWRWMRKGLKSRSGRRVRLEHIRVGGRVYTSAEAMGRFFESLAEADAEYFDHQPMNITPESKARTEHQRSRAQERVKQELTSTGFYPNQ